MDAGTGPVTINATVTGLKFFLDVTLGQPDLMAKVRYVQVHLPRKLPVILSPEEVGRLIAAAPYVKPRRPCPWPTAPAFASARSPR